MKQEKFAKFTAPGRRRDIASIISAAFLAGAAVSTQAQQPAASAVPGPQVGQQGEVHIEAQPLDRALAQLSRQTGTRILFATELAETRRAPAVRGHFSTEQALQKLLAGSGLVARSTGQGAYTVVVAPVERRSGPASLEEVQVLARVETAQDPMTGYVAHRSTASTKTDTPIVETPQSISVIGREEMRDRGAQSLMETLRYTAGIATESYGLDPRGFDYIKSRGFSTTNSGLYRDGLRLYGSGFALFNLEPSGLDRIEVLRGPSSTLYGQGDAGGLVNGVSKLPAADAPRTVEVQAGNHAHKQVAADLGGALNEEGSLRWRLPVMVRDAQSQYRYSDGTSQPDDRYYIAPTLSWKDGNRTSVTLLGEWMRDRRGTHFGAYQIPYGPSTGVSAGDPAFDRMRQEQGMLGYALEHRFDSGWRFSQNLRYAHNEVDYRSLTGYAITDQKLNRYIYAADQKISQWALDNRLDGELELAGTKHRVLVGLDAYRVKDRLSTYYSANVPPVDMNHPVYGQNIPMPASPSASTDGVLRQVGLYAQDQIDLNRDWRVTLGLRHDAARQNTNNLLNGTRQSQSDDATTWRLGVSYLRDPHLVPYASYSESFLPNIGTGYGGRAFDPSRGKQFEVGVKYAPAEWNALFTVALFDLRKTNVLTNDTAHSCTQQPSDPACGTFKKATGEVRSRGLEVEAKTQLPHGFDLVGSLTWLDARIVRSDDGDAGRRPLDVPRQQAAIWVNQRTSFLPGLEWGLGLRHSGSTYSDAQYRSQVPSYTVIDAALRYRFDSQWRLALNVSNLADRQYTTTCPLGSCYYGPRRTVVATLSHDW